MFNNLFNKIKASLLQIKSKLASLFIFKNLILYIIILFICCNIAFSSLFFFLEQSFCNFLFNYINYSNYFYLTLLIFFLISIKNFFYALCLKLFNINYIVVFNNNNLYLNFLYLAYIKNIIIYSLYFLINYFNLFFKLVINSNYFLSYILNKINILFPVSFYPIFKRHSIFGYYRIARQNWVELRTEEVNFLKY